jgi:multidrug efflux pump subunit AcrB
MPTNKKSRNTISSPPQEAPAQKTYLERLEFDPRLLGSLVAKFITNIRIVLLLAITIILIGTVTFFNLPKRLNPEVKIPIITVSAVLPGASPEDIESLITIPIEDKVRGIKGIDTISSSSLDNVSFVTIQFFSNVPQEKAKNDVQSAIDSLNNLPDNAQDPKVEALDFENQPVWTFAVTTTQDIPALMNFSKNLKRKIDDLPKVDRVVTSGFEEQEIVITVNPQRVQDLGINPLTLSQGIKKGIASYPAGSVVTDKNSYSLTIDPTITSISDIRDIKVSLPTGKVISLSEVASVAERSKSDQQYSYLATSEKEASRSVTFYVYKTTDSNIDEAATSVKKIVDQSLQENQGRYTLTTLVNTSDEINKQFTDLLHEFRSTIILVFACIFLFLGLRQAIISSFTVPLTFLSAFIFAHLFGMSINFLTMFAFLLALGLLVDDTIVVISAMTTYHKTGKFNPVQTGLLVWRDTIVPIWSTTITTIWSFVPLLLSTGIIGEFIKPIPIVVTVTMISSTAIACLITLPLMIVLLKPNVPTRVKVLAKVVLLLLSFICLGIFIAGNPLFPLIGVVYLALLVFLWKLGPNMWQKVSLAGANTPWFVKAKNITQKYTSQGLINIEPLSHWYHNTILRILAKRSNRIKVIAAIFIYAVVSFALLPLGFVKGEFFPKSDAEILYVELKMPSGTNQENTRVETLKLADQLRHTPETEFVIAELGKGAASGFGPSGDPSKALFSLHLPKKEDRKDQSFVIAEKLRQQFSTYQGGEVSVVEESGGPPAGSDLQIKLSGNDLTKLHGYADTLVQHLETQEGVTNVNKSVTTSTSKIVFTPDLQKMAEAGVSSDQIGLWLRMYASGFTLDAVNFDKSQTETEDVVFKVSNQDAKPMDLSEISFFTSTGRVVPILALGRMETKNNPTVITRENGKRTISVSAAVKAGYSIPDKNKELEGFAKNLNLEEGYSWSTGGVNEENAKSVQSILQAMVIAAILILITMVIQFNSFRQAIIVLTVIPLAVSSVFLAFALTGTPLSFPALIGVLSLFGIVVTNSMFIVDKINLNQKEGMPFNEAIADAGASRLEPIILTKLCTVFGLLPITLSNPLWRGLGGAIISGLLVSSTIMLLFIPTLYFEWFKPKMVEAEQEKAARK